MVVHEVTGKVFLITGAAAGIGAELVKAFLKEGAKHVAVLDLAEETGKALEAEMQKQYGDKSAKFFKCDVTDDNQLFHAYDVTIKEQGYIDAVINNAGLMNDSEAVFKKQVEVNMTALASSSFKALKLMRKDEGGSGGTIINISSIAGLTQKPALALYYGTKAGVLQFTCCLGHPEQYVKTGVRTVTVCFGPTNTTLFDAKKIGSYDQQLDGLLKNPILYEKVHLQSVNSAVRGVVEAYKHSEPAGTWLACNDEDPQDITENVRKAYDILGDFYYKTMKADKIG